MTHIISKVSTIISGLSLAGASLLFPAVASAENRPNVIYPIADAYVSSAHPNTNYGTASRLWVDNDSTNGILRTYLKFDITQATKDGYNTCQAGINGSGGSYDDSSAYIRLAVEDVSTGNHQAFMTSSSWTETGITYNNKPAAIGTAMHRDFSPGTEYGEESVVGGVTDVEVSSEAIDDACANHAGILSVVIKDGSTNAIAWTSRESAVNQPTLTIVMGD